MMKQSSITAAAGILLVLGASGCYTTKRLVSTGEVSTVVIHQPINELEREPVPGTVNDFWVEPMIDTVRVPGQLDPAGNYYRASHNTLVEIRPGRFQKVQYPDEYDPKFREKGQAEEVYIAPDQNGQR
jgi:hypothetical protein